MLCDKEIPCESRKYSGCLRDKNMSKDKYHIYVPQICVRSSRLLQLTNELNEILALTVPEDERVVFDVSVCKSTGLKLDGFNKYNSDTNSYEPNTQYLPMAHCECNMKQMWARTYLFADCARTPFRLDLNLNIFQKPLKKVTVDTDQDTAEQTNFINSKNVASQTESNQNDNKVNTQDCECLQQPPQPKKSPKKESEKERLAQ